MATSSLNRNPEHDSRRRKRSQRRRSDAELGKWAELRNEEIRQYLRDRHAKLDIVKTTRTPSGQQLDWVPIESQPGATTLATPPSEDVPVHTEEGDRCVDPVRFELQGPGAKIGPEGTVPIVRKPFAEINPNVPLSDWLAKGTRARRLRPADDPRSDMPTGETHKYSYTSQGVVSYGTEGAINVWDPYVEYANEFSAGQLWLSAGEHIGTQTVEVGHQEYRNKYGDWVPHLFVHYTTNHYTDSGDNKGGYNNEVDGWVQYSNEIFPEASYASLSHEGGSQCELQIKVQLWQGNWWVRINGTWIGYYPASLFHSDGLGKAATTVAWGGQVIDANQGSITRTDMGSGGWPEEGWRHAAFMRNLTYQVTPDGRMERYNPVAWESDPTCYGIDGFFDNTDNWGSYFYYGGPGKNPGSA